MAAPGELQWSCSPTPLGQQDQIQVLCQQLVDYLTMIMDPSSSQEIRNAYTKSIEEFKEENPHCLVCGFHLASDWPSPQVKHFGLQLVEHYIRFRWTKIQVIEQQEFQQTLLEYLSKQSDQEPVYVKEALARVTVELAKQMWPQRWGSFINDMDTLAKYGHSQVELVLLIFRRLAEDIHIFESDLPSKRKKEMSAALSENISDIFAFLIQNLEFPPSSSDHLRSVALSTITSFADWVDFKTLFMHECKLLKLLYTFIGIEDLKTPSCECLLNIVSRKTDIKRTADERMNLLALLSQEALDGILKASVYANSQGVVEEQYVFLKRVCQLLVHLGISQLAPLWQNKANFQRPETFELYLSVVLEFTNHGSQLLSFTSADVWTSFISHNLIKEDPVFKQFLPKLLAVARQKLFKLGDPTVEDHISSQYSSLDFDGLSEYTQFFSKYRGSMTRIIHQLSLMMPRTVAEEACVATQDLILRTSKKLENAEVHFGFTKNSMDYIEWDGLVSYLETWTGTFKIESSLKEIDDVKQKCLAILNLLLNFTTMDPLILQCQFKCLQSGLINFLHLNPEVFNTYVKKVFSCVKYLGEASEKHHLSQEARAARNQVVVCFVHLCDAQPNLLAPYLELLYSEFQALIDNDSLLYGEKCEFIEGLYTLCQMQLDLKQQQDFIGRLLQEVNQLSLELQGTVTSVPQLISYLGLDKDPSDPEYSLRPRALICYIAHAISLILRKAKTCNELGLELPINHPTYACIMPLLSKISIPLIQCLYQFWSCSFNNLLSKHFQSVTTFHLFEKDTILGRTVYPRLESVEFGEVDHVQMNFVAVHEHCLQALARVFAVYGSKHLYEIQFANEVYKIVVLWITNLNPWRLRSFIRHFMSVLVVSCSEHSWTNILVPFINKTCEHIYSVLKKRWDILAKQRAETNVENLYDHSRNMESEEVFQEQLTIHLSREFSNLLEVICCQRVVTAGRKGKQRIASDDVFTTESQDEMMADAQALDSEQWSLFEVLTPLGEKIIQDPCVRELLFICSFQGMVWDDSYTSNKCTSVAGLLFTKMPSGFFTPDMYSTLFLQVLGALQLHGAHDHVRNQLSFLALLIYQSALKICPQLHQILLNVPKIDSGKITAFDKLLEQDPAPSVKIKKEKFRDLLSGLVKFSDEDSRRKVTFDLPEMQFKRKEKTGPILTDLSTLFESDDNIASRSMSM